MFRRERNSRFCHTVFLRAGGACIHGFFPSGAGEGRRYDYLTDAADLEELKREYGTMLSSALPLLKTYTAAMSRDFNEFRMDWPGTPDYLLNALPVVTMPERLLERIFARAAVSGEKRAETLSLYRDMRGRFSDALKQGSVNMILCPSGAGTARPGRVNFALDLLELSIDYTRDEYREHVAAVMGLVENERNFHLTVLPSAPFRDIQIVTLGDAVAVLRCRAPFAAFVFQNPTLTQSVSDYFAALIEQFATDRRATVKALEEMK